MDLKEVLVAETKTVCSFASDDNIHKIATGSARDAVELAKTQFGLDLDWSDDSVAEVEKAMAWLRACYSSDDPRPTENQVSATAVGFGSYIGEVFRRNHGGQWGIVTLGEEKKPGLRADGGLTFWPWVQVRARITGIDEENVADYYQGLLHKLRQ